MQPSPFNFENNGFSPDAVDRTIYQAVNRDNGNTGQISDWFNICNLAQYTSATSSINFVGLFIDTSGNMDLGTVQASYNKFLADLSTAGLTIATVQNGAENWVLPFSTTLVP